MPGGTVAHTLCCRVVHEAWPQALRRSEDSVYIDLSQDVHDGGNRLVGGSWRTSFQLQYIRILEAQYDDAGLGYNPSRICSCPSVNPMAGHNVFGDKVIEI